MGKMTCAYAETAVNRLASLRPEASPAWGTLAPAQMIGHLNQVVRYTIGEGPDVPFRGNWKSRYIFRPLILGQLVKMPRNVRLPNPDGSRGPRTFPDGRLDALRESLDEYLRRVDTRSLPARMHPYFGVVSPAGWRRFHYAHFEHHLTQFGL